MKFKCEKCEKDFENIENCKTHESICNGKEVVFYIDMLGFKLYIISTTNTISIESIDNIMFSPMKNNASRFPYSKNSVGKMIIKELILKNMDNYDIDNLYCQLKDYNEEEDKYDSIEVKLRRLKIEVGYDLC